MWKIQIIHAQSVKLDFMLREINVNQLKSPKKNVLIMIVIASDVRPIQHQSAKSVNQAIHLRIRSVKK